MNTHRFLLLVPLLLVSLQLTAASATTPTDADARHQLQALLDEFMAGASVNSRAAHERFWADELIYTSSSGERFGKQHILDGLAASAGTSAPTSQYRATDVSIRLLSDTIAVITFVLVAETPAQDQQRYLNTGVFELAKDGWRASYWQATKVPVSED